MVMTQMELATAEIRFAVTSDEEALLKAALRAYRSLPYRGRIEVWKRPNQNPEVSIVHRQEVTSVI